MNTNPEIETKPTENLQLVSYTCWSVQTPQNSRFAWQDGITPHNHQLAHHKHQGCGLQTLRCGKNSISEDFSREIWVICPRQAPKKYSAIAGQKLS